MGAFKKISVMHLSNMQTRMRAGSLLNDWFVEMQAPAVSQRHPLP
jgi:hypothetical protein